MFICPSNEANVVAFLHGYEYGTDNKCHFTDALSEHIAKRYDVKREPLGWPHQISLLAGQQSLEWMDTYRLVSSEVLSDAIRSFGSDITLI